MRSLKLNEEYELEDLTREIEVNLIGPMRMVQQFCRTCEPDSAH